MKNIFIVTAYQVVTSESNPTGILSVVSGYPKVFDSVTYGDVETAMKTAKAEYYNRLGQNYADVNPNRILKTVTLENAKGDSILHECVGEFIEPVPEPTPEPEPEEPVEGGQE